MNRNMFALAVVALGVQPVGAQMTFSSVMAKGGSICGGAPNAVSDGPKVWIGAADGKDCISGDNTTAPDEFVVIEFDHGMLVHENDTNATRYAADADTLMETLTLNSGSLQFESPEIVNASGLEYAAFSFGMETGDRTTTGYAWGYYGMSAALALSGEVLIDTNEFYVVEPDGSVGDQAACIAPTMPLGPNTSCGAPVTISPGHFKYSLFGYAEGTHISDTLADKGWFGIRTKVYYANMSMEGASDGSLTGLTFNGGVPQDQVCDQPTQVESIKLQGANTSLELAFPQHYNYGTRQAGPPVAFVKNGSEQVQLRCRGGPVGEYFYIDYLFKTQGTTLNQRGGFFVYDPTMTVPETATTTTTTTTTTTAVMNSTNATTTTTTTADGGVVSSAILSCDTSFSFFLALTSALGAWSLA